MLKRYFFVSMFYCLQSIQAQNLFVTGQEADVILPYNPVSTASDLHMPGRIACDSTHLYVADIRNNRILIWNSIPVTSNQPADVVLGQPDFDSHYAGLGPSSLNWPYSVHSDGQHLFVADTYNHRVLIWNNIPTQNGQPADIVLGQDDFYTVNPILGPTFIIEPWDVCFDGHRLYVACARRGVLVWEGLPTTNNQPADMILGQKDFYSYAPRQPLPWNFESPRAVASDGVRLVVMDYLLHRLLVWNTPPVESGQDADLVLGQKDFYSEDPGWSTIQPAHGGMWLYGDMLFSAGGETYFWKSFPTVNNQPPDAKLPWTLSQGICYNGKYLFVANEPNNRILVYDQLPASISPDDPAPLPIAVIGQKDFNSNNLYGRQGVGTAPSTMFSTGSKLLLGGDLFSRVIIYQEIPDRDGVPADNIISMYDWEDIPERIPPGKDAPMTQLGQSWSDGIRYFLPDVVKGILLWNQIPTSDHVWYDQILCPDGQSGSFVHDGGEWGVVVYHDKILVNEVNSQRIVIWNQMPVDGKSQDPDVVLNLNFHPFAITTDGKRLVAGSDRGVAIWNTLPASNDQPYDLLLTGTSTNPINMALGVYLYDDRLFVCDTDGHRICVFNEFPTTPDQPYDVVLGQKDFDGRLPAATRSRLSSPKYLCFDGEYLWVAEYKFSDRLLGFKANIEPVAPAAPSDLLAELATNQRINLRWTDHATNERGFVLEVKAGNASDYQVYGKLAGNIDFFPLSGLTQNTAYSFRIKAFNSYGESAYSNVCMIQTQPADNHSPGIPENPYPLDASFQNNEWFLFNWDCIDPDPGDVIVYDLYLGNIDPPPLYASNLNTSLYHREYLSLAGGAKYYWQIKARDLAGATSASPIWTFQASHAINQVYLNVLEMKGGTTNPPPGKWQFDKDHLTYTVALPDSVHLFSHWTGDVPDSLVFQNPLHLKLSQEAELAPHFVSKYTDVAGEHSKPGGYRLEQNYPNPFNAQSIITYSLPEKSKVSLSIYNTRGELVEEIVNAVQNAGNYHTAIGPRLHASGIYFMVLKAENAKISFRDRKKIVLIK